MAFSAFKFPVDVPWITVTIDTIMQPGTGYFVNGSGSLNLTLPTASSVGDVYRISDIGGNGFVVKQNTGQSILLGSNTTSTGAAGSIVSAQLGSMLSLYCKTLNTGFIAVPGEGNFSAT